MKGWNKNMKRWTSYAFASFDHRCNVVQLHGLSCDKSFILYKIWKNTLQKGASQSHVYPSFCGIQICTHPVRIQYTRLLIKDDGQFQFWAILVYERLPLADHQAECSWCSTQTYLKLPHTPEQEKNLTNKTVKLNMFMAAAQCQSQQNPWQAHRLRPTCTPEDCQLDRNM
jgi:hypothetical protein